MFQGAPAIDNPTLAAAIDALPPDADEVKLTPALTAMTDFLTHDPNAQKAVADYRTRLASYANGIDDKDFTLRFQTYVSRNNAPSKVFEGLYSAFAAAQDNPLIVAVNIVGPENGYVAMRDYSLHMQMFRFLKQRFPAVHLALHAGELTLGMVPPEGLQQHIAEAVDVAGAERIGHGVDVTYEANADQLLDTLAKRRIAVEVNLSSNAFILGVVNEAHPVTVYARHHVPFVISTDDAGVSRNNLSGEYLLYVTRYKPSYGTLKQVVYNSIRYAFLSPGEKSRHLHTLDIRFADFEARVARLAATITSRE
jgi:adenosine deaminase/adenosine deaminase CECR1